MQVVSQCPGRYAKEPSHVLECFLKKLQRLEIFQVSDMLAEDGIVMLGESKRILQLPAEGRHVVNGSTQI